MQPYQQNHFPVEQELAWPRFDYVDERESAFIPRHYASYWDAIKSGTVGVEYCNLTHFIVEISGPINKQKLIQVIEALPNRHPILNYIIEGSGREAKFLKGAHNPCQVQLLKAQGTTQANLQASARSLAESIIWSPFDLEGASLCRLFLIEIDAGTHLLGGVIHHAICDDASIKLIINDIASGYRADQLPLRRPSDQISYLNYVEAYNSWADNGGAKVPLARLQPYLADAPRTQIPLDYAAAPEQTESPVRVRFALNEEETSTINLLAERTGVSVFRIILAINLGLLATWQGSDVMASAIVHGRYDKRLISVVGAFANIIPIRMRVDLDRPFKAFLSDVSREWSRAVAFAPLPFPFIWNLPASTKFSSVFPLINFIERSPLQVDEYVARDAFGSHIAVKPVPIADSPLQPVAARTFQNHAMLWRRGSDVIDGHMSFHPSHYRIERMSRIANFLCQALVYASKYADDSLTAIFRRTQGSKDVFASSMT